VHRRHVPARPLFRVDQAVEEQLAGVGVVNRLGVLVFFDVAQADDVAEESLEHSDAEEANVALPLPRRPLKIPLHPRKLAAERFGPFVDGTDIPADVEPF